MAKAFPKLLAINFGGIGDEILFLPTLQTIREAHPDWHITLLVEPRSKSVKEITNVFDDVVTFDIKKKPLLSSDLVDLVGILKGGGYDLVLSSGSSPLVSALLFLSGIPERVGYHSGILAKVLLTKPVRLNRNQYAANMYHDLVQGLGLSSKSVIPALMVPQTNLKAMKQFVSSALAKAGRKKAATVLIHPGTSLLALQKGIIKTWAPDQWAALIERLTTQEDIQVILAGGPDDTETVNQIQKELSEKNLASKVISAAGQTKSLADLAALIQLCDLLVCVDSAPMHVGVGLSKPLVSLFGPTDHKLLVPQDKAFKALSSKSYVRQNQNSAASSQQKGGLGVQLPPDIVFQSVLDQLRLTSNQVRYQESPG
jgi:ADP-heptose:LPS heptosyltransferase